MKLAKKYIILLLFLGINLGFVNAHPFYVSICQIDYNESNQSLEIAVKIFADDLLQALEKEGHRKIYLGEPQENENTDLYIFNYLKEHLNISVEEKGLDFLFVGKEVQGDVVWTYVEITDIKKFNSVDVKCDILVDIFDSQKNIIQVSKNGEIKNLLFDRSKTAGNISF